VEGGKFLGFMLTYRGIKANPEKCRAITELRSLENVQEIQRLIDRLTCFSRFMPKLVEKTTPIVQLLRKASKFQWTDECEVIFLQLKEPIIVYLVVSEDAINAVLVQKVETEERPVYFVSRVLHGAEVRYQMIEKVALALVITVRRMRMHFQNHRIIVITDYPIMKILVKPDLAERMIRWTIELSKFQIQYQPRRAIKSQVLADFLVELSPRLTEEKDPQWTLHINGSSNSRSCGAGVVLEGPGDVLIEKGLKFEFKTSNN